MAFAPQLLSELKLVAQRHSESNQLAQCAPRFMHRFAELLVAELWVSRHDKVVGRRAGGVHPKTKESSTEAGSNLLQSLRGIKKVKQLNQIANMAMSTALVPSCSQTLYLQQRRGILSVGRTECRGQRGPARGLSSGVSFQGVRLAAGVSPAQLGLATSRGGVARAEQLEVGTTTATTSPPPTIELNVGGVTEVDKDTFWPIVKSAGEKVVVLDMYTQWCGPCKLMLPQIIKLAEKLVDEVIFLKLDCNQHNKVLAKELGIRVVPTFKIFKENELFGEVTGAKYPDLVAKIDDARKS